MALPLYLRQLPNILTVSRLFFTAGYLLLLGWENHHAPTHGYHVRMDWGFVLFLIAGLTDIIDGPLARRMNVTSKFGRTFDPFVDKILVIGGFILLAWIGHALTGVAWWMVAVVIGREVLVTIVRHISEAQGTAFGATWAGKLKMFLQCFAIGTVMVYLTHVRDATWAIWFRDITLWIATLFTACSALIYLQRIRSLWKKR